MQPREAFQRAVSSCTLSDGAEWRLAARNTVNLAYAGIHRWHSGIREKRPVNLAYARIHRWHAGIREKRPVILAYARIHFDVERRCGLKMDSGSFQL
jgi:hypothetical protein